jgi:hypothetical protein
MYGISSRMQFLLQFVKVPPAIYDVIFPHGPVLSVPMKEYMIAGVVRDISNSIPDKKIREQLMNVGREMAGFAADNLVKAWEDGDICPPWPYPWPFPPRPKWPPLPWPWPGPPPDPDPWHHVFHEPGMETEKLSTRYLASAVSVLAEITTIGKAAEQLKEVGAMLGR